MAQSAAKARVLVMIVTLSASFGGAEDQNSQANLSFARWRWNSVRLSGSVLPTSRPQTWVFQAAVMNIFGVNWTKSDGPSITASPVKAVRFAAS
jgi:hypothetical protein